MTYQEYLCSREWALKREAVRKRSNNTCERCNYFKQTAVHHLTYERIYKERLDDLQAVCKHCHDFVSGIEKEDRGTEAFRKDFWAGYEFALQNNNKLPDFDKNSSTFIMGWAMGENIIRWDNPEDLK